MAQNSDQERARLVGRSAPMPAGPWVLMLAAKLEEQGVPCVYLRNHEELPLRVGNDVDLLVPAGTIRTACEILKACAQDHGWRIIRAVRFSPLSVFLTSRDFSEFLHIDLFDRLEWHFIEYATAAKVLSARVWNGLVFHPSPGDECYLNLVTRLIYHGKIRDKHRLQFKELIQKGQEEDLRQAFMRNLGPNAGGRLMDAAKACNWDAAENMACDIRRSVIVRHAICSPLSLARGVFRYISRSLARLIRPPGPFIIFEGVDGVGKSSVIDHLQPFFKDITGRTDALLFHWKPARSSLRFAGTSAGPAMNPRSKSSRSLFASILFLAYHWLGFWSGYLRFVLPARSRNRAVVGERYAYEFFLDPARLHLHLPEWLARIATATTPQPDLVICMVADVDKILSRKSALGKGEIFLYQDKLEIMSEKVRGCKLLRADADLEKVASHARNLLLRNLFLNR